MHFSWAMDLDPKGANSQIKDALDPALNRQSQEIGYVVKPGGHQLQINNKFHHRSAAQEQEESMVAEETDRHHEDFQGSVEMVDVN